MHMRTCTQIWYNERALCTFLRSSVFSLSSSVSYWENRTMDRSARARVYTSAEKETKSGTTSTIEYWTIERKRKECVKKKRSFSLFVRSCWAKKNKWLVFRHETICCIFLQFRFYFAKEKESESKKIKRCERKKKIRSVYQKYSESEIIHDMIVLITVRKNSV